MSLCVQRIGVCPKCPKRSATTFPTISNSVDTLVPRSLKSDEDRWREYMRDSIVESTISRDVLQMENVRKPALMRALFELGAQYSAQELSYRKILGQLDDKGNTDTIKHYLDLLSGAGMISGLQKFDDKPIRAKASSPRLMVHDPALMTSMWHGKGSLLEDPDLYGHLVETAVGAYLIARSALRRLRPLLVARRRLGG